MVTSLAHRRGRGADEHEPVGTGDRCQELHGLAWATQATKGFRCCRLLLSQSFRCGEAIADEATRWLWILGAELRLRGIEQVNSAVPSSRPLRSSA